MSDLVLAERRGPVLVLTLNRPERLNAWTDALEECYFARLDAAEDDPGIRAIVVTGAGRGFCAGADMDDLARGAMDGTGEVDAALRNRRRPRTFPLTVRKPMIAAINGAAAGLGLVEALYCDIRFAVPEAKLTTAFARRGLVAEYGLSWILPRLVGHSTALDLLLSGRVVLGEEAVRLRLADRLSEPGRVVADAVAYAEELATASSPWSMATIKAQVHADLDRGFCDAVASADELMIRSFHRPDVREGVDSYQERRAPVFPPLEPRSQTP
jgi:enoyl-CoA hydratase/carnithine racemase